MGSGDIVTITLSGGGPWGFRLMGGGTFPIQVAKIRKKSKASLAGMQEGDNLISINGVSLVGRSHEDAMNQVDNAGDTLTIEVQRSGEVSQDMSQEMVAAPEQNGTTNEESEPVVTSSSTSYSVDGENIRSDVVNTKHESRSADGVETKTYTERVTKISTDSSKPASVTQQTLQVSYSSNQSDMGKENISPTTGIFAQNKWNTVPRFNVRNNTLKPAVHGNQQVQQQSPSPVPKPSIFKPALATEFPQRGRSLSPSVMQPPASPSIMGPEMRSRSPSTNPPNLSSSNMSLQMRSRSPLAMQPPVSPSIMSPQMRSSPVPTPTKFTPAFVPEQYQPPVPPKPIVQQPFPESELYFEVPKPRMPKPEPPHFENDDFESLSVQSTELDEHHHHTDHHQHLPIFAPPVEFYPEDLDFPDTPLSEGVPDLEMRRVKSLESECSVDSSRAGRTRRSTCHSLVADLQSKKNRGAKLFQKRQARSEKWVIDESNAKKAPMSPPTRLETMLSPSSEPSLSPWDAAMQNPVGSVDAAFSPRHRQEQLKKYQPVIQPVSTPYQQQRPQPPPPQQPVVKHNLRAEEQLNLITGPTYNRSPRGWGAQEDFVDTRSLDRKITRSQQRTSEQVQAAPPPPPPPPPKPSQQQDNYNRKIKAWGCHDDDGVKSSWSSTQNVQYEPYGGGSGEPTGYRMSNTYNYQRSSVQQYQPQQVMLPGSDL
ncbi:hypothetical protein KUTeg_003489 [Tegillarca granosa]|uniref:PDZ domain-containing protein n=1 Tax=Tegillarca granosa TaxID=220873 RepID=A0ABQ9FMB1_TEGGR|nr:hypothetical protein KUTeg_003489 [Tegillarca granosa]